MYAYFVDSDGKRIDTPTYNIYVDNDNKVLWDVTYQKNFSGDRTLAIRVSKTLPQIGQKAPDSDLYEFVKWSSSPIGAWLSENQFSIRDLRFSQFQSFNNVPGASSIYEVRNYIGGIDNIYAYPPSGPGIPPNDGLITLTFERFYGILSLTVNPEGSDNAQTVLLVYNFNISYYYEDVNPNFIVDLQLYPQEITQTYNKGTNGTGYAIFCATDDDQLFHASVGSDLDKWVENPDYVGSWVSGRPQGFTITSNNRLRYKWRWLDEEKAKKGYMDDSWKLMMFSGTERDTWTIDRFDYQYFDKNGNDITNKYSSELFHTELLYPLFGGILCNIRLNDGVYYMPDDITYPSQIHKIKYIPVIKWVKRVFDGYEVGETKLEFFINRADLDRIFEILAPRWYYVKGAPVPLYGPDPGTIQEPELDVLLYGQELIKYDIGLSTIKKNYSIEIPLPPNSYKIVKLEFYDSSGTILENITTEQNQNWYRYSGNVLIGNHISIDVLSYPDFSESTLKLYVSRLYTDVQCRVYIKYTTYGIDPNSSTDREFNHLFIFNIRRVIDPVPPSLYVYGRATDNKIYVPVNKENTILDLNAVPKVSIEAFKYYADAANNKIRIAYSNAETLESIGSGQFRISKIEPPPGITVEQTVNQFGSKEPYLKLTSNKLDSTKTVNVGLQYYINEFNGPFKYEERGSASTTYQYIPVKQGDLTISFKPNPNSIEVYTDIVNNITEIPISDILVTGVQYDPTSKQTTEFTYSNSPTNLEKGTFRITDVVSGDTGLSVLSKTPNTNTIKISPIGTLSQNTTLLIYLKYKDAYSTPTEQEKSYPPLSVTVIRLGPATKDVTAEISPNRMILSVDYDSDIVIDPIIIPPFLVTLREKTNGNVEQPRDMIYNAVSSLQPGQFKIKNIIGSSIEESFISTTTNEFSIKVYELPNDENCYVEVEYKDSNGVSGTKTLQFLLSKRKSPAPLSDITGKATPQSQLITVSDTFRKIIEPRDVFVTAEEVMSKNSLPTMMKYVHSTPQNEVFLTERSTFKIWTVEIYNKANVRVTSIFPQINSNGSISFIFNELKEEMTAWIWIDYIDIYGNTGTKKIIAKLVPELTPPQITKITYPAVVNAADYRELDVDFDFSFESKFSDSVSVFVNEEGRLYGHYKPNDSIVFNMQDLVNRFGIRESSEDIFIFDVYLLPSRLNPQKIGNMEVVQIQFNRSRLQVDRPFILRSLHTDIKEKFDFDIYRDETRKYLTHFLHIDGEEPRLIANWNSDDITFSKFETNELGIEELVESNPTLVLKLYEPLPENIQPNTSVWITKQRS